MNKIAHAIIATVMISAAAVVWAGPQARFGGRVTDTEGNPLPKATITITTNELTNFEKSIEVAADGTFKAMILDATRVYILHVSADGYVGQDREIKIDVGSSDSFFDFKLESVTQAQAATAQNLLEQPGYKELAAGKKQLAAGQTEAAMASFKQALEAVPNLVPALEELAKLEYKSGDKKAAMETAKRCLDEDDESLSCLAVAANASQDLGDSEAHERYMARYQDLNPDDPATVYNQAVEFLNAMDDDHARPLLEQCLEIDSEYAPCLFQYGMVLLRGGDTDGAKQQFQHYLEVAPDGPDAQTAAETVKYLS